MDSNFSANGMSENESTYDCTHSNQNGVDEKQNDDHDDDKFSSTASINNVDKRCDNFDIENANYREEVTISDDESVFVSTSSLSSLSDYSSDEDNESCEKEEKKPHQKVLRTKGEMRLEDLPKIEELNIKIPEEDMEHIGEVSGIVDQLVVVNSVADSSPLNDDSVLFLAGGVPLGKVFETFGPVIKPMYSVRFNSAQDIKKKGIKIGDKVYFAPSHADYTLYVFINSLRKEKGSDASWLHNNEPPIECLDYSDDEKEKAARRTLKAKRHRNTQGKPLSSTPSKVFTNKQFSKKVPKTQRNTLNTPLERNYFREAFTRVPSSSAPSCNFWDQQLAPSNLQSPSLQTSQSQNSTFCQTNLTPAFHAPLRVPSPLVIQSAAIPSLPVVSARYRSPMPYTRAYFQVPPPTLAPPPRIWAQPPAIMTCLSPPPGYSNPSRSSQHISPQFRLGNSQAGRPFGIAIPPPPSPSGIAPSVFMPPLASSTRRTPSTFISPPPTSTGHAPPGFMSPPPSSTGLAPSGFLSPPPSSTGLAPSGFMSPPPSSTGHAPSGFMSPPTSSTGLPFSAFMPPPAFTSTRRPVVPTSSTPQNFFGTLQQTTAMTGQPVCRNVSSQWPRSN